MTGIAPTAQLDRSNPTPVILVVEDDVLIRSVIAEYLREEGFKVIETTNAREAIEVIASQAAVDLVFTDHNMPGAMDGRSLVAWLARHRPELPAILTSGTLSLVPGDRENHAHFVAKPYQVREVEQRIRHLLSCTPR